MTVTKAEDRAQAILNTAAMAADTQEDHAERISVIHHAITTEINMDRAETARWYRSTIALLLKAIGGEAGTCKSCGKDITWIVTKTGKRAPVTVDGLNHFADCAHAATHRKT